MFALRLSPPVSVASSGGSSRNNADTTGERFRDREFAVHNLERERRQGAGRRAVDHRRALAWIIVRIMTRAFEKLLLCCPPIHLTTRMRTNRGLGNDAVDGAIPRWSDERRGIEMQQHNFVEA